MEGYTSGHRVPIELDRAMSFRTRVLLPLLGVILILLACWPLFRYPWFTTDDGLFHLYRLASLARHVKAGHFYPRWFADFAFGYGHPILNYYAPLSYYAALLLMLLLRNPVTAMKALIIAGTVLGAWGMYLLGKELGGEGEAGLLAALLYLFFPYRLADVYTRGAIPEALAFASLPFVLWAWWRASLRPRRGRFFLIGATAWAALILTHSLSVLLAAPLVALWFVAVALQHRAGFRPLVKFVFALVLGVGLGAFYWLPARVELPYVFIGVAGISRGYERHLLSAAALMRPNFVYPYAPAGTVATHPIPSVFVLAGAVGGVYLLVRKPRARIASAALILILAFSILMRWDGSLGLWHRLEKWLDVLQYPWRFMLLTGIASSALAGGLVPLFGEMCRRWGLPGRILWPVAVVFFPAIALVRLPVLPMDLTPADLSPEAMWQHDFDIRQIGATWTAEFVPVWVRVDRTAVPRSRLPDEPVPPALSSVPEIGIEHLRPLQSRWRVKTPDEIRLLRHQFYFPGWEVRVDGVPVPPEPFGPLGLLSWRVPAGEHSVEITFSDTPIRRMAALASAAALLVLLIWLWREEPALFRGLAVAAAMVLLLLELYLYPFKPAHSPVATSYNLADKALLVGYEAPAVLRPGQEAHVTLYWLGLEAMAQDYKAFVHVFDPATGRIVAQHDGDPVGGFTPTTRWVPGELVADEHTIPIPPDAPPGRYVLGVGLYEFATLTNLPVKGQSFPGNRIPLTEVEIRKK